MDQPMKQAQTSTVAQQNPTKSRRNASTSANDNQLNEQHEGRLHSVEHQVINGHSILHQNDAQGPLDVVEPRIPNGLPDNIEEGASCHGTVNDVGFVDDTSLPDVVPNLYRRRSQRTESTNSGDEGCDMSCGYRDVDPDLIWIESENVRQPTNQRHRGDDMEQYFNENSHMLEDMHISEGGDQIASLCVAGNCTCVLEYHITGTQEPLTATDSVPDVLEADGEETSDSAYEQWNGYETVPGMTCVPDLPSPALSSDDHDDFIEADIPRPLHSYASSRTSESKDSATSSYEELPEELCGDNPNESREGINGSQLLPHTSGESEPCNQICPSCNTLCQGQLLRRMPPDSRRMDYISDLRPKPRYEEPYHGGASCNYLCQSSDSREADRRTALPRPGDLQPLVFSGPAVNCTGAKQAEVTPNSESGSSYRTMSTSFQSPHCSECSPYGGTTSDPSPFVSPDAEGAYLGLDPEEGCTLGVLGQQSGGARKNGGNRGAVKKRSISASDPPCSAENHPSDICECQRRQSNPEATSCSNNIQTGTPGQDMGSSVSNCDNYKDEQGAIGLPMRNIFYFRGPELRPENDPHLAGHCDDSENERFPLSPPGLTDRTFSNPPSGSEDREPVIPWRRTRGVLMYHDYDSNNLNPTVEISPSDQHSQLFNVSRQTSTSNFDQDENSFQELSGDSECFLNAADYNESPPAIPGRPDLVGAAAAAEAQYECVNLPDGVVGAQAASIDRRIVDEAEHYPEIRHYTSDWIKKVSKFVDKHYVKRLMNEGKLYEDVEEPETRQEANRIRDRNNTVDKVLNQTEEDRNALYSIFVRDYVLGNLRSIHRPVWYIPTPEERDIERVMLWTEYQAYVLQVKQIGRSACGATSIINALKVFEIYVDKGKICDAIHTNMRSEEAPVGEYLLSRSVAGVTADCLIKCLENVTNDGLYARFFCTFPQRELELRQWLGKWMKKGAVPILTLNLQRGVPPTYPIPDAWHHQMVYGVGPKGLYLTNPQEVIPEKVIQEQLNSDMILMIRRQDVTSRWQERADNLGPIINHLDAKWKQLNVIGEIVNVMREERSLSRSAGFRPRLTSHITIPAWYRPGITLIVQKESVEYYELLAEPELPLKSTKPDAPNSPENTNNNTSKPPQSS